MPGGINIVQFCRQPCRDKRHGWTIHPIPKVGWGVPLGTFDAAGHTTRVSTREKRGRHSLSEKGPKSKVLAVEGCVWAWSNEMEHYCGGMAGAMD